MEICVHPRHLRSILRMRNLEFGMRNQSAWRFSWGGADMRVRTSLLASRRLPGAYVPTRFLWEGILLRFLPLPPTPGDQSGSPKRHQPTTRSDGAMVRCRTGGHGQGRAVSAAASENRATWNCRGAPWGRLAPRGGPSGGRRCHSGAAVGPPFCRSLREEGVSGETPETTPGTGVLPIHGARLKGNPSESNWKRHLTSNIHWLHVRLCSLSCEEGAAGGDGVQSESK